MSEEVEVNGVHRGKESRRGNGFIVIMLFLILLALVFEPLVERFTSPVSQTTWEYRIDSINDLHFQSEMNSLGEEGWELVFARRARNSITDEFSYECIFKRKRTE